MNIGVHGKAITAETKAAVITFFEELQKRSCRLFISDSFIKSLVKEDIDIPENEIFKLGDDLTFLDVVFSLGGDGTLLEAVTYVRCTETPLLGINTGRLGFLANTSREDIGTAVENFFSGDYSFDRRTLLSLNKPGELFGGLNFALNDFTILKKDTSSMIVVHTYLNGEFLNSYWADGIIVSTPTGSTGYSLSCGGPLIIPQTNNFIITPVCPHNLTVRPMVVPDESEVSFKIEGRSDNYLVSLDSRFHPVDEDSDLVIKKADFQVKLIKLPSNSYLKTLRQKLNWGLDVRN